MKNELPVTKKTQKTNKRIRDAICQFLALKQPEKITFKLTGLRAGVGYRTIRRRALNPWKLLDFFNKEVQREFKHRREIQRRMGKGRSSADYFYAVASTLLNHREYVKALVIYYEGGSDLVTGMLRGAAKTLWAESYKSGKNVAAPRREQFIILYDRWCLPILFAILREWIICYDFYENYRDFYAAKMGAAAAAFTLGEQSQDQLRKILCRKPDVQLRFFYDSNEWESLGKK